MTDAPIQSVRCAAYTIGTDHPESDGTLAWNETTMVVVHVEAGGRTGTGWTYATRAAAVVVEDLLAGAIGGVDAMDIPGAWAAMEHAVRNQGRSGVTAMAISAVDIALWDLKGKLMGASVADLLGSARPSVEIYGSGGFSSYSDAQLAEQFTGWVAQGISRLKMKIGRGRDAERVRAAREALGEGPEIYADANGAYRRKQALGMARGLAPLGVTWFEEPVDHHDLAGLRLLRDRAPAGMDITAGEYGYELSGFPRLIGQGAVDVLQADCTRCGGITGWMRVAALAQAHHLPISSHCAPALHVAPGCAAPNTMHLEYFHDHARIERLLFDAAPAPIGGRLTPDRSRPGLGYELKRADAEPYRV